MSQPASPVINDMSLQVATVNGSGSQSANMVLLRTLFQMGVPVSGKNLFPSNIAGLPTWYTIRASKDGWIARKKEIDLLVAMNAETAREDVLSLRPGSAVVYDEPLQLSGLRSDLAFYPVPFDKVIQPVTTDAKLKKLLKNMAYVGVVAQLLGLEMAEAEAAIAKQFRKKAKAAELNVRAARAGFEYATASLQKKDPFQIRRMDANRGKIIIDGNAAAALGAMFGGVTVVTWYPITPSSSLVETLISYMRRYRIGPDGKSTFAIVQAEDELAAVGMVVGAGWAGARAMTATAGPWHLADVRVRRPRVLRRDPGGDLGRAAGRSVDGPSHADVAGGRAVHCVSLSRRHPAHPPLPGLGGGVLPLRGGGVRHRRAVPDAGVRPLRPGPRHELLDGRAVHLSGEAHRPGKVLSKEDLERLGGFERYRDVDGDGIRYRTLPGTDHPGAAYFTRGTGHNEKAQYSERPDDWENNLARLERKMETARRELPAPMLDGSGAEVGIIGYGSSHHALVEARDQMVKEKGLKTDYLRVLAYPFSPEVQAFIERHPRVYVVEQNRDGQLAALLKLDLPGELVPRLRPVAHIPGLPLDARSVTDEILAREGR